MGTEIVVVTQGELAGSVGCVLRRDADYAEVRFSNRTSEVMHAHGLAVVAQAAPYAELLHVHRGPPHVRAGRSVLLDRDGFAVAEVSRVDAHVLAAAPVLLDLVEQLARIARGAGFASETVRRAEAAVDFLRRSRVGCFDCGDGPCATCGDVGVLVGAREASA